MSKESIVYRQISVKERLPEREKINRDYSVDVVCYHGNEFLGLDSYCYENNKWSRLDSLNEWQKVTHWLEPTTIREEPLTDKSIEDEVVQYLNDVCDIAFSDEKIEFGKHMVKWAIFNSKPTLQEHLTDEEIEELVSKENLVSEGGYLNDNAAISYGCRLYRNFLRNKQ